MHQSSQHFRTMFLLFFYQSWAMLDLNRIPLDDTGGFAQDGYL